MNRRSDEYLESFAARFREIYGIVGLQCPDVDTLIERVAQDKNITLIRKFDDEMPLEEASADCTERIIYYRESLRSKLKEGDKKARFIFLEEIGHIILGHTGIRHRSLTPKVYEKSVAQVRIEESEARYFAAAVLAPIDKIPADWDALKISEVFQMSLTSAEIRKGEADKLRRISTGLKRELPDCVVDFLKEAKNRGYPVQTQLDP